MFQDDAPSTASIATDLSPADAALAASMAESDAIQYYDEIFLTDHNGRQPFPTVCRWCSADEVAEDFKLLFSLYPQPPHDQRGHRDAVLQALSSAFQDTTPRMPLASKIRLLLLCKWQRILPAGQTLASGKQPQWNPRPGMSRPGMSRTPPAFLPDTTQHATPATRAEATASNPSRQDTSNMVVSAGDLADFRKDMAALSAEVSALRGSNTSAASAPTSTFLPAPAGAHLASEHDAASPSYGLREPLEATASHSTFGVAVDDTVYNAQEDHYMDQRNRNSYEQAALRRN